MRGEIDAHWVNALVITVTVLLWLNVAAAVILGAVAVGIGLR